ncbi:hypothetical protein Tco_1020480 [Tanacetum coccineum]
MDDRGASSLCIALDFAPSSPSLSVVPSAWLVGVDCNRVGKGGSRVLIPDLVVIAKVGVSGSDCGEDLREFFMHLLITPPLFFGERVEIELSELIEFHTVIQRYVIVKDLYQKPFLYSMMGDLFDQVLEADPGAFDGFVDPLFESEDHVSKG